MQSVHLTIFGNLASKSNNRKLVNFGGKPRFIKSERARDWEKTALMQITGKHRVGLEGNLKLTADVYYDSRRPDLDVSLLMDVLQTAGVYRNDRQIHELCLRKFLDVKNPRVEVEIEVLSSPLNAG